MSKKTTTTGSKRKREACGRPRKEQQAYVYESYSSILASSDQDGFYIDDDSNIYGEILEEIYDEFDLGLDDVSDFDIEDEHEDVKTTYNDEFVSSKFDKFLDKEEKQLDQQFNNLLGVVYRTIPAIKRRRLNEEIARPYSNAQTERLFSDIMSHSFQSSKHGRPSLTVFLREYMMEQQQLTQELNAIQSSIQKQKAEKQKAAAVPATKKTTAKNTPSQKDRLQKSQRQRQLCLDLALEVQKIILDRFPKHLPTKTQEQKIDLNLAVVSGVDSYWKKHEKLQAERVKKAIREEAERKEKERHDRKLNFLLTQTELYSHFMSKKSKGDDVSTLGKESVTANLQQDEFEQAKKRALDASSAERQRLDQFNQDSIGEPFSPTSDIITEPRGFHGKLKKYQLHGLQWLVNLYNQGINGMLCDEMGLGKTVQTIAFLTHIHTVHKPRYPFLIITPTTTLHNWLAEFTQFSPQLKILPYWGNTAQRKILRAGVKNDDYQVLLSSYGMIIEDYKALSKLKFHFMVLDEAHAIKSSESIRWKKLLDLDVRGRMLLTGTPIQNHLGELWALLHFVMPKLFDDRNEFEEWFSPEGTKGKKKNLNKVELDETQLQRLHMILRPFMLRRLKTEVESELAPKQENVKYCELNTQQREAYIAVRGTVNKKAMVSKKNRTQLMNTVMQLRKICNHPYLFLDGEKKIPEQFTDIAYGNPIRGLEHTSPFIWTNPLPFRESDSLLLRYERNPIHFDVPSLVFRDLVENIPATASNSFLTEPARNLPYNIPVQALKFLQSELTPEPSIFEAVSRSYVPRIQELVSLPVAAPPIEEHCSSIRHAIQTKHRLAPVYLERRNLLRGPEVWHFIAQCSKMTLLDSILSKIRLDNNPEKGLPHKVLIFCQMTRMLDLLSHYCIMKKFNHMRMDGSTNVQVREALVQQFQSPDDKTFIFLLSTRAGGIGINLTKANHVIFYDCDWNPTLDAQAMDRVHRIGQKRTVHVMRLVSKNTVEERILQIGEMKMDIQSMVYKGSKAGHEEIDIQKLLLLDDEF